MPLLHKRSLNTAGDCCRHFAPSDPTPFPHPRQSALVSARSLQPRSVLLVTTNSLVSGQAAYLLWNFPTPSQLGCGYRGLCHNPLSFSHCHLWSWPGPAGLWLAVFGITLATVLSSRPTTGYGILAILCPVHTVWAWARITSNKMCVTLLIPITSQAP